MTQEIGITVKVSFCQFLPFFVLFCFPSGSSLFLAACHLCMGFQWAAVLSGLSLLWHGCCSCLKVFFCHGATFSKMTFPATSPGMSPTMSPFLYIHLFTYLVFLLCILMSPFVVPLVSPHVSPVPTGSCPFQNAFKQR